MKQKIFSDLARAYVSLWWSYILRMSCSDKWMNFMGRQYNTNNFCFIIIFWKWKCRVPFHDLVNKHKQQQTLCFEKREFRIEIDLQPSLSIAIHTLHGNVSVLSRALFLLISNFQFHHQQQQQQQNRFSTNPDSTLIFFLFLFFFILQFRFNFPFWYFLPFYSYLYCFILIFLFLLFSFYYSIICFILRMWMD